MLLRSSPVSATWVRVTSWSSPKFTTAPSARNRSLNSNEDVPRAAPSEASGTKAVVAVIVVPWIVLEPVTAPVTARVLDSVVAPVTPKVPATVPFASTSSVSTCAVPSIKRSLNSNELVPRSISLSVTGTIAPSCILICSTAELETSTKKPQRLLVLSATILLRKSKSPIVWMLPPCPAVPSCLCPVVDALEEE